MVQPRHFVHVSIQSKINLIGILKDIRMSLDDYYNSLMQTVVNKVRKKTNGQSNNGQLK